MSGVRLRHSLSKLVIVFVIILGLSSLGSSISSRNGRKSFQSIPKSVNQQNCPGSHGCKENLTDADKLRLNRLKRAVAQDYGAHFSIEHYTPPQLLELAKLAQQRKQGQEQDSVKNEVIFNQSPTPLGEGLQNEDYKNIQEIQQNPENGQASFSQKSGPDLNEDVHLDMAIATAAAKLQEAYDNQLAVAQQFSQRSDQEMVETRQEHEQNEVDRNQERRQHQDNYDSRSNFQFQKEVYPILPTPIPDWPPGPPHIEQRSGELNRNNDYHDQSLPQRHPHPHPVYHPQLQHRQQEKTPHIQNFEFTLDPDGRLQIGQSREMSNFGPDSQQQQSEPRPHYSGQVNEHRSQEYHHPHSQPSSEQYRPSSEQRPVFNRHPLSKEILYSQPIYPGPQPAPPSLTPFQQSQFPAEESYQPQRHEDLSGHRPHPQDGPHPFPPGPGTQIIPGSKIIAAIPHQGHGPGAQLPPGGNLLPAPPTTAVIAKPTPLSRADHYDTDDDWGWSSGPGQSLEPYHTHHHHDHFHLKKKEELLLSLGAEVAWKIISSYIFVFIANAVIGIIGKALGLSDSYLETKITLGKDGRHPFEHYGTGGDKKGQSQHQPKKGWAGGSGKETYYPGNPLYHPSSALYHQPTYQYYPKGKEHTLLGYDQHHALKYAKKYSKKYSKKAHKYGLKPKPILPYIPAFNYGHDSIAWGRDDQSKEGGKGEIGQTMEKADKLGKAKTSEEKSKEQEDLRNKSRGESSSDESSSGSGDVEEGETDAENADTDAKEAETKVDVVEVELVDPKSVPEEDEEGEEEEEEGQTTLATVEDDGVTEQGSIVESSTLSSTVASILNVTEGVVISDPSTTATETITEATTPGISSISFPATNSSEILKTNSLRRNLRFRQSRPLY